MRMGPVSFLALLVVMPLTLCAQRQASLGVGIGVVRYAGGSSFRAFTPSPALPRPSPASYLRARGSLSPPGAGGWVHHGRGGSLAAASRRPTRTRLAAENKV